MKTIKFYIIALVQILIAANYFNTIGVIIIYFIGICITIPLCLINTHPENDDLRPAIIGGYIGPIVVVLYFFMIGVYIVCVKSQSLRNI